MYRRLLFLFLVFSIFHSNDSQQVQMPDLDALSPLTGPVDPAEQLADLQRNVSSLWTYIYELRGAVTHHLNHLRQHQVEMENAIHRLEHHGDGHSESHSSSSGHHHSGENHSHSGENHSHSGEHSHDGDDHSHGGDGHTHDGDGHSHGGDGHSHGDAGHSHGGDEHSHGGDGHSHGGDGHSHSGEHQSHGHYHESHSHSHSDGAHTGHEDNGHHHDHKDSHENADDLQQTAQVSEPLAEPVIVPTTRQSHSHHHHSHSHSSHSHVSSSTPSSSRFQPLNVMGDDGHHHDHHSHAASPRNRTRMVVMPKSSESDLYEIAVCNVQPNTAIPVEQQQNIGGQITLWQKKIGGPLNIHVRVSGFAMGDHHAHHQQQQQEEGNETPTVHKHGFHIHSSNDLSNGCQNTGPHYNPKNMNHGGPKALVRHVGDLGNIECDDHGVSNLLFSDDVASLKGPFSIVGKSMVIHSGQDDLGLGNNDESLKTGNAGVRIACCVIQKADRLPIRSYRAAKQAIQYQNW